MVNASDEVILYYVESATSNVTACTRYAWSTIGFPTLFISQDSSSCECEYDIDIDEYTTNQTSGSVNITGTKSYFSLAIVFTRLIEFVVSSKNAESYSKFNATEVCSELDNPYDINPMELTGEDLNWTLSGDQLKATLKSESNFSFTINVSLINKISSFFASIYSSDRVAIWNEFWLIDYIHNIEKGGESCIFMNNVDFCARCLSFLWRRRENNFCSTTYMKSGLGNMYLPLRCNLRGTLQLKKKKSVGASPPTPPPPPPDDSVHTTG